MAGDFVRRCSEIVAFIPERYPLALTAGTSWFMPGGIVHGGVAFGLAAGALTAFLVELLWDRPEEKKPGPPPASDALTPAQ